MARITLGSVTKLQQLDGGKSSQARIRGKRTLERKLYEWTRAAFGYLLSMQIHLSWEITFMPL